MGKFVLGAKRPLIIAGPCSAETREQTVETAMQLARSGRVDVIRAGVWKPRTQPGTFEGVGEPALEWLNEAKAATGLPIAVEVANRAHVECALRHGVDLLWIGARTTVSPFAVQEIAESLRGNKDVAVLIKNPMVPDINLWAGAVNRLIKEGIPDDLKSDVKAKVYPVLKYPEVKVYKTLMISAPACPGIGYGIQIKSSGVKQYQITELRVRMPAGVQLSQYIT